MQFALVLDSKFVRRPKMLALEFVKHDVLRESSQMRQSATFGLRKRRQGRAIQKIKLECGARSAC
jgi:hypothetical protein